MFKFVKDMTTQMDGESYCAGRVLWILGALAFIGISVYALYHGGAFDPQNWGLGYGSLLGGGGAGIWAKSKAEPE